MTLTRSLRPSLWIHPPFLSLPHGVWATLLCFLLPFNLSASEDLQPSSGSRAIATIPLEWLDPFGPPRLHYDQLRPLLKKPEDIEAIITRLLSAYRGTHKEKYLLWSLSYAFLLWQSVPRGQERVRVSLIGTRLVGELSQTSLPPHIPAFWEAVFMGTLALSQGILNTLQYVPEFIKRLKKVEESAPSYFYGSSALLLAKMYIKLPPFPLSLGNISMGMEYLEKARPYQERTYALWYVVKAEGEYLLYGKERAYATLDQLREVCPVDVTTRYTYEMAIYLSERFREAIETGSYDKYLWDPLLEPITPLIEKGYTPSRFCD